MAEDGVAGINKSENGNIDVVITDMVISGIDGSGVCQYIRKSSDRYIFIIGISGTAYLLYDVGFDAILPKPFPIKKLVDSVTQLLKKPIKSEINIS